MTEPVFKLIPNDIRYSGYGAKGITQCRICDEICLCHMPARFALEGLPTECDRCSAMSCYLISENEARRILRDRHD